MKPIESGLAGGLCGELLRDLPVAAYVSDADGRLTFINDAAVKLLGQRPKLGENALTAPWRPRAPGGAAFDDDALPLAIALRERRPARNVPAAVVHPNGARLPVSVHSTPLFDAAGAVIGATDMLIETTDLALAAARRLMALKRVARSQLKELALTPVAQEAIDSAVELASAAFGVFFMAEPEQTVDRMRLLAVAGAAPKDLAAPGAAYDPARLAQMRGDAPGAAHLLHAPIISRDDEPLGLLVLGRDRHGPFSAEEESVVADIAAQAAIAVENARLFREARRLSAIVENSEDAIVSKSLDGVIASWNKGAEKLFGYTAEEAIGQSIEMLIPEDRLDEEPRIIERIRSGAKVDHFETVRLRKDGGAIDISLAISPIRDADGRVVGASKIARDITERKQAEARQQLLAREIQHRTKNLFSVVQVVVARSFTGKKDLDEARAAVIERLQSLAQAHDMLVGADWRGAALSDLVEAELKPFADRLSMSGPALTLAPKAAQSFALALHELATNAAKYGALSTPNGRVSVAWSVADDAGEPMFSFEWKETGGPPVAAPRGRGFGSTVLVQVMTVFFDDPPTLAFEPDGARYSVRGPLEAVTTGRRVA